MAYDQLAFKLSGAAMGLSFAFVGRFVGDNGARAVCVLGFAWFLWLVSLACVLVSHYSAAEAMRATLRQVDTGNVPAEPGGLSDRMTKYLNTMSGTACVLGLLLGGVFMICNIGGNRMPNDQESTIRMVPTDLEKRGARVPAPDPRIVTPAPPGDTSGKTPAPPPPSGKGG